MCVPAYFFPDFNQLTPHHTMIKDEILKLAGLNHCPMAFASVLAGTACAIYVDGFNFFMASLLLLFAVILQIGANLWNIYTDLRQGYGERIDKGVSMRECEIPLVDIVKEVAIACFVIACMIGLGIVAMTSPWLIIAGVLTAVATYLYNRLPCPLSGTIYSIIFPFLFLGVVGVYCSYYIQAYNQWNSFEEVVSRGWAAAISGIVIGFLAANAQLLSYYIHTSSDLRNSKPTISTRLGKKIVRRLFMILGIAFYLVCILLIMFFPVSNISRLVVLILPTLSFLWNCLIWKKMHGAGRAELRKLLNWAIWNPLVYSLLALLLLGIALAKGYGITMPMK